MIISMIVSLLPKLKLGIYLSVSNKSIKNWNKISSFLLYFYYYTLSLVVGNKLLNKTIESHFHNSTISLFIFHLWISNSLLPSSSICHLDFNFLNGSISYQHFLILIFKSTFRLICQTKIFSFKWISRIITINLKCVHNNQRACYYNYKASQTYP